MAIVRWNRSLNPAREIDELFNHLWGEDVTHAQWVPSVDIRESGDAYEIDMELPAVASEDVNVSVLDNVLSVSGERKVESAGNGKVHRIERHYGRFARSFRLPEDADEERIEAAAKNGVLHVKLYKREQVKPRAIEVKVA